MYTREERSQLKQAFWTTFGQYMSPCLSSEGLKVNWTNYKTGIKYLYFRMEADNNNASIGIEITHPDPIIQELFFEQFMEMKSVLEDYLQEEWDWQLFTNDENSKVISRIFIELKSVNLFNKEDWPNLISFFKPRIIALDQFWSDAKHIFEPLK